VTALDRMKRRLRDRSEHYLMLDSVRRLGAGSPGTSKPYRERGGVLWRRLFVPVYRRLPWGLKRRAMTALRMTATGWKPPERRPRDPWRPPGR
jgi:hypothetical protein